MTSYSKGLAASHAFATPLRKPSLSQRRKVYLVGTHNKCHDLKEKQKQNQQVDRVRELRSGRHPTRRRGGAMLKSFSIFVIVLFYQTRSVPLISTLEARNLNQWSLLSRCCCCRLSVFLRIDISFAAACSCSRKLNGTIFFLFFCGRGACEGGQNTNLLHNGRRRNTSRSGWRLPSPGSW